MIPTEEEKQTMMQKPPSDTRNMGEKEFFNEMKAINKQLNGSQRWLFVQYVKALKQTVEVVDRHND
tara:strand:- start:1261 stop:1458 length:198 start_codon:yes stop_codon:yes gene_type:complete